MCHQYQGGLLLKVKIKQEISNTLAGGGIQVACGLVGKQDDGLAGEGAGDGDALLLAAG